MSIFDEHNWYLLYFLWLSLSRSLKVSESIFVSLNHALAFLKVAYKHAQCQFSMIITFVVEVLGVV